MLHITITTFIVGVSVKCEAGVSCSSMCSLGSGTELLILDDILDTPSKL